ncbi:uncharacterized protein FIBRA_00254 [Fibroporia radiculosa]|uniref:Hyaluronan/mRNA-binding protein domain-containing protein n=1 Tax=Fibroporia radiculosa TaxID=599839 RepID=J7RV89_9APHY|nr:uncharacterized protein FIBRA_00254 [Fibroporia radiculosa]CCL98260.1 predicted protein [Fibroporia radiculosa]
MTRTERAAYPRAIIKDRSEAKNAMNKRTPKSGAGGHNWGDLQHERDFEEAGMLDEEAEPRDTEVVRSREPAPERPVQRRTSSLSEEELQQAREFRKRALKRENIDLASIARTSAAVSVSPPNRDVPIVTNAETSSLASA